MCSLSVSDHTTTVFKTKPGNQNTLVQTYPQPKQLRSQSGYMVFMMLMYRKHAYSTDDN